MNILKPEEMAGLTIEERLFKCCYRAIRENRPQIGVRVCGRAWEAALSLWLHRGRPLEVIPSKDGSSARIRLFVCGRPLWVSADENFGEDFDRLEWIVE